MEVIKELAEIYPQLYLDHDRSDTEAYRAVVLRGDRPESKDLSHFVMDPRDKAEHMETPAGTALVTTLYDRKDFETFVRIMMAAKDGLDRQIPATMGASTLITFNWDRIRAHKERFIREQLAAGVVFPDWPAEFAHFREAKENYLDMLIVLSRGPYSNVKADDVSRVLGYDVGKDEWLDMSDDIRKYHELTHFVCRKLFPDRIDAVWDELVADAAGIYAALGRYDRKLEELFLGINDCRYAGGRLENYIDEGEDADSLSEKICGVLKGFESMAAEDRERDVFGFMLMLEDCRERSWA